MIRICFEIPLLESFLPFRHQIPPYGDAEREKYNELATNLKTFASDEARAKLDDGDAAHPPDRRANHVSKVNPKQRKLTI